MNNSTIIDAEKKWSNTSNDAIREKTTRGWPILFGFKIPMDWKLPNKLPEWTGNCQAKLLEWQSLAIASPFGQLGLAIASPFGQLDLIASPFGQLGLAIASPFGQLCLAIASPSGQPGLLRGHSPNRFKEQYISEVVRIGTIIVFHLIQL